MAVPCFLLVLTILSKIAITVTQYIHTNGVIFDLTRPVNELINEKISRNELLSDVHSAFGLIGANVSTSTVLYATAGGTVAEMEEQTIAACKVINDTIERTKGSQLLILWKLNSTTLVNLLDGSYNITFDGWKPLVIVNLYTGTGCEGVDSLSSLYRIQNDKFVGVGLDESSIKCKPFPFSTSTQMFVVNIKFGQTMGVTESFGLFETRLKFLSEGILDLKYTEPNQEFVYFPTPNYVGNDNHNRLLIRFAKLWTASEKTLGSIVVPVPYSRNEALTTTQFDLVPGIYYYNMYHRQSEFPWSSVLLSSVSKQKQTVVINAFAFNGWNFRLQKDILTNNRSVVGTPIDIYLDYSKKECGLYGEYPWYAPNDDLYHPNDIWHNQEVLTVGKPGTIIVSITKGEDILESKENDEDGCFKAYVESVKRLISKKNVGCKYATKTFQTLMESNATEVVNSCQRYNGSFYILETTVKLEWFKEIGQYSFYFENIVRKELHAVNGFRQQILEMEPSVKVYFTINIEEIGRPSLRKYILQLETLFCESLSPTVNLYFEGIFNWAMLESFPIIFPIDSKYYHDYFEGWVSLMRRLNYPYSDSDSRVGATFYPEDIFNNKTNDQNKTKDGYGTMLHFVFFRFRLIEFSFGSNFQSLIDAIRQSQEYFYMNTQILINYDIQEMNSQREFPELRSVLGDLKKEQVYKKGLFRGLHTKILVEEKMYGSDDIKASNLENVSALINLARKSNISVGVELPSFQTCNEMLQNFIAYRNSKSAELIGSVDYIICKETSGDFYNPKRKSEWESVFDSHLMLKRVAHQFVPHLQVFFRVELDIEIGKNNATLYQYTNLLALFKTFGATYNISYLIVDAFDNKLKSKKTGWWGITNYSDLANPKSYVEKGTVYRGQRMWYPSPPTQSGSAAAETQVSKLVIIGSSVGSGVLLLLLILVICLGLRYKSLRHLNRFLSDSEVQEFLNGRISANMEPANMELELMGSVELEHMKFNQEFKLNLPDITIDFEKILGAGAFGMVYKGLTKNTAAAIKRPNADCSKTTFKSVLTEVKVLAYIGNHSNVVGFLGAYIDEIHKGVLYISTELCSGGSLETFLRTKSNVISETVANQSSNRKREISELYVHELNTFAMEIAQGMEYIESKRVVHGDLATRNVLLDDNLVCKIGDFGLSRKLYEYQKYVKTSQEPLPWKWMAHESLTKMEFTSKSDVWSFGVALWEIYSLGKIPYAGLNWTVDFAKELQNGLRLPIPDFAPENIFSKILECWKLNPEERPTFADFVKFYKSLDECAYLVLDSTE